MSADIAKTDRQRNSAILIPCDTAEFGSFISGLLRAPRKIARISRSHFNIERVTLTNLYYLVRQRVEEQPGGTFVSFSCEIFYSDGRSFVLSHIEDLESFAEVGARTCVAVTLSWIFLIDVRGSEVPQKQSVDLTFYTGSLDDDFDPENRFSLLAVSKLGRSSVNYLIEHTAVTFGYDLANLLDEEIRKIHSIDRVSSFVRGRWGKIIRDLVKLSIFIMATIVTLSVIMPKDVPSIDEYLAQEVSGVNLARLVLSGVIFYTYYVVFSRLIESTWRKLGAHRPSTISLSSDSAVKNSEILRKFERRWMGMILPLSGTFIMGVMTSLSANQVWDWLGR